MTRLIVTQLTRFLILLSNISLIVTRADRRQDNKTMHVKPDLRVRIEVEISVPAR